MAVPVAIIGSTISHGGVVTAGSTKTKTQIAFVARQGDAVTCDTHGSTTIATGSPTCLDLDGKLIARIGDTTACGATITSGDPTVMVN